MLSTHGYNLTTRNKGGTQVSTTQVPEGKKRNIALTPEIWVSFQILNPQTPAKLKVSTTLGSFLFFVVTWLEDLDMSLNNRHSSSWFLNFIQMSSFFHSTLYYRTHPCTQLGHLGPVESCPPFPPAVLLFPGFRGPRS